MRRPLTLAGLALLALPLAGCTSGPFANLFTFSQEKGGNLAASDSVGARMAGQRSAQQAKARDKQAEMREAQAGNSDSAEQAAIVR